LKFKRYALYYAPPEAEDWAQFATSWLGWDMAAARAVAHPDLPVDVAKITQTPRKYGLHATIKPPFALAAGHDVDALHAACAALCARLAPVTLDGLALERLGGFLALRPVGDQDQLNALAAACVSGLDLFRAPASQAELDKRRARGLSAVQERNLLDWGYPYLMDDFRFHITLTGRLPKAQRGPVLDLLDLHLVPLLPTPFVISDLALTGEDADGRFHLLHRYTLSG